MAWASGRHPEGFSLVEVIFTLVIMGMLVTMGSVVFTDVLDYYQSRRSAETLLVTIRRLHEQARARGLGAVYGLKFYSGRLRSNGSVEPSGFSYLTYGGRGTPKIPLDSIADLDPDERARLVSLSLTVRPVEDASVAVPATVAVGRRFQFARVGDTIQLDAPSPSFVDLYDQGVGYFRLSSQTKDKPFFGLTFEPL